MKQRTMNYSARKNAMSLTEWMHADGSKYQFILSTPRYLDIDAIEWLADHLKQAAECHRDMVTRQEGQSATAS